MNWINQSKNRGRGPVNLIEMAAAGVDMQFERTILLCDAMMDFMLGALE